MEALKLEILNNNPFSENILEILEAGRRSLLPRKKTTVSKFIAENRYVSAEESARPGMWDNSLTPFAAEIMDSFADPDIEHITMVGSAQVVKALSVDTPILTVDGWKTMGEIKKGDTVYGIDGKPTKVIEVSEVSQNRKMYEITFTDNNKIKACEDHQWLVKESKHGVTNSEFTVRTTKEMLEDYKTVNKRGKKRYKYVIPNTQPVELPKKELPIPPYILGQWLGNGSSMSAIISSSKSDVEFLKNKFSKYELNVSYRGLKRTCAEFLIAPNAENEVSGYYLLNSLKLIGNKHIPDKYKFASKEQRLELLHGLMDSDGTCKNSKCSITQKNKKLAEDIYELVNSLGLKASFRIGKARLNGRILYDIYVITFTSYSDTLQVFSLPRKLKEQKAINVKTKRFVETLQRRIKGIKPINSEPMKCIAVGNETHTYLAGKFLVPTHNTEIIKNILFYIICVDPAPTLLVYPTEDDARAFSIEKLEPMIASNPILQSKIAKISSRSKDNKTLYKKFAGGFLAIVGSNSPMGLRRRSVKYVIIDDRDGVRTAGDEGDAAELAGQRTESYKLLGAKILEFSTPTIKNMSPIMDSYEQSDKREYYLPCPECGEGSTIDFFENIHWDKDKDDMFGHTLVHHPETARFVCKKCGSMIEEKHKQWMLQNGVWRPKNPSVIRRRGYMINRFYSPFSHWGQHAQKFLDVKSDPTKLQVFYNTTLARTWEIEESNEVDATGLMSRNEDYLTDDNPFIPNDIVLLTAGVDTQADRLELSIIGFAPPGEPYAIAKEIFVGDTDQDDPWNELEDYLDHFSVQREDGARLSIRYVPRIHHPVYIDSGGRNTQSVYRQCKKRYHKGWIAVKGKGGYALPIIMNRSKVGPNRDIPLQIIGVDGVKTIIMKMLQINKSPNKLHTTKAFCDINFFQQLTAEKARKVYDRRLGAKIEWVKKKRGIRNEELDKWVYAIAAMINLNVKWEKLKQKYIKMAAEIKADGLGDSLNLQPAKEKTPKTKAKKRRAKRATGYSVYNY